MVKCSMSDVLTDDLRGLEVTCREYSVATADGSTEEGFAALGMLLNRIRLALGMDVIFVSEFVAGRRVFRHVDASEADQGLIAVGSSNPLEESFCQLVVDGRLPQVIHDARTHSAAKGLPGTQEIGIGAHLSVPVVLPDGHVFGTVCCFSHSADPLLTLGDADALRSVAGLIARTVKPQPGTPHAPGRPA
jgi:GAF domain-containing protein